MKLYKVVLNDGRHEFVPADSYQIVDDQYLFYANGSPIPDVFFVDAYVVGIKVEAEDYDPNAWGKFARKMNVRSTYGVDEKDD